MLEHAGQIKIEISSALFELEDKKVLCSNRKDSKQCLFIAECGGRFFDIGIDSILHIFSLCQGRYLFVDDAIRVQHRCRIGPTSTCLLVASQPGGCVLFLDRSWWNLT
jgi:hypothetical protein